MENYILEITSFIVPNLLEVIFEKFMFEIIFLSTDYILHCKISLKCALVACISSHFKFLILRTMQPQLNIYASILTPNTKVKIA